MKLWDARSFVSILQRHEQQQQQQPWAQIVAAAFWQGSGATGLLLSCTTTWPIMLHLWWSAPGLSSIERRRKWESNRFRWKSDVFSFAPSGLDLYFANKQTRCGHARVWTTWAWLQTMWFERVQLPQHTWSKSGEIPRATDSTAARSAEAPDDSKYIKNSQAAVSCQRAADGTWKQQLLALTCILNLQSAGLWHRILSLAPLLL